MGQSLIFKALIMEPSQMTHPNDTSQITYPYSQEWYNSK